MARAGAKPLGSATVRLKEKLGFKQAQGLKRVNKASKANEEKKVEEAMITNIQSLENYYSL